MLWTPAAGWSPPLAEFPAGLDLLLYFGESRLMRADAGPLAELLSLAPARVVAGCSAAGAVLGPEIHDEALVVVGVRFGSSSVGAALRRLRAPEESGRVGEELARDMARPGLRHVLVMSDGLLVNGSALAEGLRRALPPGVTLSGGLAGDGNRFRSTAVGLGGDVGPGRVVALGFSGPAIEAGFGVAGGWSPFGPERIVTRSEGNVVHSLDGEPALALYRRYLGPRADQLPGAGLLVPLQIMPGRAGGGGLIRTMLAIDEEAQSITFAGDVPQGGVVRLMRSTRDALIESAGEGVAPVAARAASVAGDSLALVVSCVGRRGVLGQRCEEELELALSALPPAAQLAGFYSYGELAPSGVMHACELHNQTLVLTLLGEREP